MPLSISLAVARRFLAIRHLLAPPRSLPPQPESVLAVVDRLGSLQFDPLEVAGRNHDLVLAARIDGYRRELADELLYGRRLLFETYNKGLSLLPTRELPFYRISWQRNREGRAGRVVEEQAELAARLLARIEAEGPLGSADFERLPAISWYWGPTSAVRAVLEALSDSGRLGLARREGNRRFFDLIERLYPADLLAIEVPEREQLRHKLLSRFRAHGLLGTAGSTEVWLGIGKAPDKAALRADLLDRGEILPVNVEGFRGQRFIVADELPLLTQAEREVALESPAAAGCAFIAPLDPLLWDRAAIAPLYGFDYRWEVYMPASTRRWGYYVLPILFGDRLVGRIEPRVERATKTLRLLRMTWENGFDPLETEGFGEALGRALAAYVHFAGADLLAAGPNLDRVGERLLRGLATRVPGLPLRLSIPSPARPSKSNAGESMAAIETVGG